MLHGAATEQISRKMKYPTAKHSIAQEARAHGMIQTMKIDESLHPAEIFTKPLQGNGFDYKRARVLGVEGGVPPPRKGQSEDTEALDTTAQEPAELAQHPAACRKEAAAPAGAGMAARYEQLALGSAPWRRCGAPGRAGGSGPGTWGHP